MTAIRVLLADDHPVVRSGIRSMLEKEPDLQVVGEASNGNDALALARSLTPDVLLLDMELPGIGGHEVARRVMNENLGINVLALSAYADRRYIQELLEAGAAGYLIKEEAPESIVEAVRGIARGERGWFSRRVTAQMSEIMNRDMPSRRILTDREMEVLERVVEGKTNQEIAHFLHISEKTVEKHLESVFSKLGVASRVEAAVYATREGWFSQNQENGI